MFRIGGDSWTAGSYDPGTNLIYWATARPSPGRGSSGDIPGTRSTRTASWRSTRPAARSSGTTSSCPARPTTWTRRSRTCSSTTTGAGRSSRWASWRFSGSSTAPPAASGPRTIWRYQTILDVHPETGAITYRPGMIPQEGVELEFCPSVAGFKSWRAMAYHPDTRAFYVPLLVSCERTTFGPGPELVEGGGGVGISRRMHLMHPQRPDGGGGVRRHRRRRQRAVAASNPHRRRQRRADHRRRAGGRGRLGPESVRARRAVGGDPVPDADAELRVRVPHQLRGGRAAGTWRFRSARTRRCGAASRGSSRREKQRPAGGHAIFVFTLPSR